MKKRITRSVVPNLFTLVNLFAGFTAIVKTSGYFPSPDPGSNEILYQAAFFLLIAGIFDMLDGMMARYTKSTSEFGAELDSLCDIVSFAIAPSFMLYKVFYFQYGEIGILVASLPAIAGAIRLARFNVQLSSFEDKKYFRGLPTPSSALIIVSYIVFYHISKDYPDYLKHVLIYLVTAVTTVTMVSNIRYDNIPRPSKRSIRQRPVVFGIFIFGLAGSVVTSGKMIFPFMLFYLIAGAIRHFINWLKTKHEPEDDIDESDATEPTPFD